MNRRAAMAIAGLTAGGILAAGPTPVRAQPTGRRQLRADDFGAKGDGVSDDTQALQRALDAAFADEGGNFLFIPPGTYRVSRTMRISPKAHVTRANGIIAHGACLQSTISNGGNVLEIVARSTFRFLQLHGLEIRGAGGEGTGILLECQEGGKYLYNFSLQDVIVQGCGGDGCRMIGNVFEGQVVNGYFRNNRGNGLTLAHGKKSGILSAIHVFASVFGENGSDGVAMLNNCYDASFHGCYFLLNQQYGLVARNGCTLLSHCGFENNHQAASDFAHGGAGLKLNNFGTLVGCTAYSVYRQTALLDAFVSGNLVLIGCTGSGGGRARGAILGRVRGDRKGSAIAVGCSGRLDAEDGVEILELGGSAGLKASDRWDGRHVLQLGDHHLWVDASGALRIKKGAPRSDRDGRTVGSPG